VLAKQQNRRYARIKLKKGLPVAWEYYGGRKISIINVLALGGLFVSTPEPPPVGDVIRLMFEVMGGEVRARGMIRDCQPGRGMGIEFTYMRPEARAKLNLLVKTLAK
jgi:hypothetical protein